jgi:hypothetical protein
MRGVREEIIEGLEYHQGGSIRYERVEASNSCARILIFSSFSFIAFLLVVSFDPPLFAFLWLSVLLPFPFFVCLVFLSPFVPPPPFHPCFVLVFWLMWVSSYPNLLGTKSLGCCITVPCA